MNSHIDVTIDFSNYNVESTYDLRIPIQISTKQLLLDLVHVLKLKDIKISNFAVKVKTKKMILVDDDMLEDFPITNGDILTVLGDDRTTYREGVSDNE
ncbi:EsaB/YukD family protein [Paraliobacillus ryukyuensis]|uniref:EsaB/YukD family protein n=1 Tax=Paraliobacillus ryukyuensis TaxID=200904 RepID=UPI0021191CA8|nr:EsaB/YukD family protein [Paraliobacillus ryukyuensis]